MPRVVRLASDSRLNPVQKGMQKGEVAAKTAETNQPAKTSKTAEPTSSADLDRNSRVVSEVLLEVDLEMRT